MFGRVLLTGANGFLATAMRRYLTNRYPTLRIDGVIRPGHADIPDPAFHQYSLDDVAAVKQLLEKTSPDAIFHFAGGRYAGDDQTFHANITTTRNVLTALSQLGRRDCRVLLPGSAAEYGNLPQTYITEECLPQPLSWYGLVKLMQTQLGLYAAREGQSLVVGRMFNICGTQTPVSLAIGRFAQQIVAIERGERPVIITKNLDGQRDFLDITDVCRGLWDIACQGKSGEIYNLCSQQAVTIRSLLHEMLKLSSVKNIDIQENKNDTSLSFNVIGAYGKLGALSGFRPQVTMGQSLLNTLNSYRC